MTTTTLRLDGWTIQVSTFAMDHPCRALYVKLADLNTQTVHAFTLPVPYGLLVDMRREYVLETLETYLSELNAVPRRVELPLYAIVKGVLNAVL